MKIEVKNITKKFKENCVINKISATFESGKVYGLYGRNGSGKSVFLKMIAGLYIPTTGEILYDGIDLNKEDKYPISLRAFIERPSFFPDLTGYQNLKLLAEIQDKIGDKEIINLIEEKDKKFSKYSLGMKQKLGIAQVIMEDPEVLIFDEPFNGIEKESVNKIMEYLKSQKEDGKCIFISTHIMEDLNRLADHIYEMDCGSLIEVSNEKNK